MSGKIRIIGNDQTQIEIEFGNPDSKASAIKAKTPAQESPETTKRIEQLQAAISQARTPSIGGHRFIPDIQSRFDKAKFKDLFDISYGDLFDSQRPEELKSLNDSLEVLLSQSRTNDEALDSISHQSDLDLLYTSVKTRLDTDNLKEHEEEVNASRLLSESIQRLYGDDFIQQLYDIKNDSFQTPNMKRASEVLLAYLKSIAEYQEPDDTDMPF